MSTEGAAGARVGADGPDDRWSVAPLGRDDLPAIGALFTGHTGRPADLDRIGSWVAAWPSVGASRDGALVGYALGRSFAPDIVELASLLVAPAERGHGLGPRLVVALEEQAAGRGLHAVVAVTSTGYEVLGENRSARPLYERLGYSLLLATPTTSVMGRSLGAHP